MAALAFMKPFRILVQLQPSVSFQDESRAEASDQEDPDKGERHRADLRLCNRLLQAEQRDSEEDPREGRLGPRRAQQARQEEGLQRSRCGQRRGEGRLQAEEVREKTRFAGVVFRGA